MPYQVNTNVRVISHRTTAIIGKVGVVQEVRGGGWHKVLIEENIYNVRTSQLSSLLNGPLPGPLPPPPPIHHGGHLHFILGGDNQPPPDQLMNMLMGMLNGLHFHMSEEEEAELAIAAAGQSSEEMAQQQEDEIRNSLEKPKENKEMASTKVKQCPLCIEDCNCYELPCCKNFSCINCWYEWTIKGKGHPKCAYCRNPLNELKIK